MPIGKIIPGATFDPEAIKSMVSPALTTDVIFMSAMLTDFPQDEITTCRLIGHEPRLTLDILSRHKITFLEQGLEVQGVPTWYQSNLFDIRQDALSAERN